MYEELVKRLRSHNGWALNKTLDEAADAIEELQEGSVPIGDMEMILEEVVKPYWIPVTERLPEYSKHVLVYAGFFQPYIEAAYYCEDKKWRFTYDDTEVLGVSHWMPLPDPPKDEEI